MNNVFKDFKVGNFFDLKGSSQGRDLLQPDESMDDYSTKYGKTALKDNDFRRFFRGKIVLDETDDMMAKLDKKEKFKTVIEKDSAFFARTDIIDYSLLLGEIQTPLDTLEDMIEDDRSLTHGVYMSTVRNGRR